jgi:hypothetical protein
MQGYIGKGVGGENTAARASQSTLTCYVHC